jgi:predicted lipoprotein with Yx(FWY)xxD motif
MLKIPVRHGVIALCASPLVALIWSTPAAAASHPVADAPLAVPAGVTLVDVSKGGYGARDEFLWRRLGDAQGNPLFTYTLEGHSGASHCYDECAREFPPFLAPSNAVAFGDWTLIRRPEGRQWAYQGQPLYSHAGRALAALESDGGNGTERGFASALDPGGKSFSPRAGWKEAVYDPVTTVPTPADVRLESDEAARGYAFVAVPTGMPLYILEQAPQDTSAWTPFYASTLALPVGDFSKLRRSDGTEQWAYKGQRLYTYNGDYSATDINGITQPGARIALAYRLFTPHELAIQILPTRPPMMTTARGLSVYTEARYHLQYGGRETRGGYHYTYEDAKAVGTGGCTAECTRIWRPVLAPSDAQGSGFWEVMTRPDGSKQWAYKGSALYTYVGDHSLGDIRGNNQAVIVYGDAQGKVSAVNGDGFSGREEGNDAARLMSLTGGNYLNPRANYGGSFGAGFYWHLVPLYN